MGTNKTMQDSEFELKIIVILKMFMCMVNGIPKHIKVTTSTKKNNVGVLKNYIVGTNWHIKFQEN